MKPDQFHRIVALIHKKLENELSYNEQLELERWLNEDSENQTILDELNDGFIREGIRFMDSIDKYLALETYQGRIKELEGNRKRKIWRSIAIAASFFIIVSACAYWIYLGHTSKFSAVDKTANQVAQDLQPVAGDIVLTLSDGSQKSLNNLQKGIQVAADGNSTIASDGNGLVYNMEMGKNAGSSLRMNRVETGKGKSYKLALSDGSVVWLNAQSSIVFPVAFSPNERNVELSGEAYFEIATNKQAPFKVKINGSEIQVLGTKFNVNAYRTSRSINTTLFEGSVLVKSKTSNIILKPDQQSFENDNGEISISKAGLQKDVLAWRNGKYSFDQVPIQTIMEELIRNYEINEVIYQGDVNSKFSGVLRKDLPLSEALAFISKTDLVHFELVEGNKIIVKP